MEQPCGGIRLSEGCVPVAMLKGAWAELRSIKSRP